jgi:hypothetical protein
MRAMAPEFPPDELLPTIENAGNQEDVPPALQALADEHAAKVAESPDNDDRPDVPQSGAESEPESEQEP